VKRRGQDPGWRQQAAERLDQVLALPMLVLTVVFLAVLVLPVIYPDVPAGSRSALEAIDLGIWTDLEAGERAHRCAGACC